MADDGVGPPDSAEKKLGDILGDISSKASLLVREEIELAKAEVAEKAARLGRGAAAGVVGGLFALLGVIYLLHMLAYLFNDLLDIEDNFWAGYGLVALLLFVVAGVAGFLAYRFVKRAIPPAPQMAIEEARLTREAIEEVRH